MKLILVLRLFRASHAKEGIEAKTKSGKKPYGTLIRSNAERLHPALKNIAEYLRSTSQIPVKRMGEVMQKVGDRWEVAGQQPAYSYWCEVETDSSASNWQSMREVEAVIAREEFDKFALSIRYMSGTRYVEACEQYAQSIELTAHDPIRYDPPRQESKVAC